MMARSTVSPGPDWMDRVLVVAYLVGLYLGIALKLPGGIPIPAALAGAAGVLLVLKHFDRLTERHIVPFVAILLIALLSVLSASDYAYLGERFKGFIQFSYSILIGYGFFLAARPFSSATLARVFLVFSVAIIFGCALENFVPAFRQLSDSFRGLVFDFGVYVSDLRDQYLYGRIRPKLFTSEPSAVAFSFTLFTFAWYVLARMRAKLFVYLGLLAAGYVVIRSPTLLLGVGLVPVYELFLAARQGPATAVRINTPRVVAGIVLGSFLGILGLVLASDLFSERIAQILAGQDPSFFSRIIAPMLVAGRVIAEHPVAGAGLTGWESILETTQQVYAQATWLTHLYTIENAAHAITNNFWLHWIFFGLFWGFVVLLGFTWLLRALGAPSLLFCWAVWVVFGQASGGYVDPKAWSVLFIACLVSVIHEREARAADTYRFAPRVAPRRNAGPPSRPQPALGSR